jgi:hypothetical protein
VCLYEDTPYAAGFAPAGVTDTVEEAISRSRWSVRRPISVAVDTEKKVAALRERQSGIRDASKTFTRSIFLGNSLSKGWNVPSLPRRDSRWLTHLAHESCRVLVRDDFDSCGKFDIAAYVVDMSVGIDDGRNGLLVIFLSFSRIALPQPGSFVSTRTTPVSVINAAVPAAAHQHEQLPTHFTI